MLVGAEFTAVWEQRISALGRVAFPTYTDVGDPQESKLLCCHIGSSFSTPECSWTTTLSPSPSFPLRRVCS